MARNTLQRLTYLLAGCSVAAFSAYLPATAQQPSDDAAAAGVAEGEEEVTVTARRRSETLISVPVAATVVSKNEIERRGVVNIDSIARITPQLVISASSGSIQGGAMGLRGISAGEANPLGDQAVAFNLDGVQVARSSVRRMGEFDLQQVEVLRGPQALFYGKNSPAGIVVLNSADPGSELEAGISAGYEFVAKQYRFEGFVSGALSDSFGVRLAAYMSDMEGWVDNVTPANTLYPPRDRTAPSESEYGVRLTLKYDGGGPFTARLKAAYGEVENGGLYENVQRVVCPQGGPQGGFGTNDNCIADDQVVGADFGPNFGTLLPIFGNGRQSGEQKQTVIGFEANYDITPALKLSSLSSYYRSDFDSLANITNNSGDSAAALNFFVVSVNNVDIEEFSQELRLSSDFDGPFNFLLGGFYQKSELAYLNVTARNANAPTNVGLPPPSLAQQDGEAYSFFLQGTYDILPTLELSAGVRYSHEQKDFSPISYPSGAPIPTVTPERSWTNTSPEISLTYRPSDTVTIYANYKHGFLSGGFNGGTGSLALDRSYDQQLVKGFEIGAKALFLDRTLSVDGTIYSYDITGQQVSSFVSTIQFITNAGSSKSEGAEINVAWRSPETGFSLRGGLSYNDAKYERYTSAPCFGGQTPAQGCTITGGVASQDLSGQRVVRAPEWAGYVGLGYDIDGPWNSLLSFSVDANYTSEIFTEGANNPFAVQEGYWLVDASARLELEDGIAIALIGRNLTNEYFFQRSTDMVFLGSGTGTPAGVRADTVASVSRGREIMLKISYAF